MNSNPNKQKYDLARNSKKFDDPNLINGYDYIMCKICGLKRQDIGNHVIKLHNVTVQEYKLKYSVDSMKCQKIRDISKVDKNPAYQHGGKYSAWSKNFVNGYDPVKHQASKKQHSAWVRSNKKKNVFAIEYWLERANGDLKLAQELYTKSQTRDLSWFVAKYGEEEGKARHQAKTNKWLRNFKKQNFSQISQELFIEIIEVYQSEHVFFATHEQKNMNSYKNKEYRLKLSSGKTILPDFIDIRTKKIIEFDGDYWHGEQRGNQQRDCDRDQMLMEDGFCVLHIKERDYKANKQGTLDACLKFLTE